LPLGLSWQLLVLLLSLNGNSFFYLMQDNGALKFICVIFRLCRVMTHMTMSLAKRAGEISSDSLISKNPGAGTVGDCQELSGIFSKREYIFETITHYRYFRNRCKWRCYLLMLT
jgi:hypothetical protein